MYITRTSAYAEVLNIFPIIDDMLQGNHEVFRLRLSDHLTVADIQYGSDPAPAS